MQTKTRGTAIASGGYELTGAGPRVYWTWLSRSAGVAWPEGKDAQPVSTRNCPIVGVARSSGPHASLPRTRWREIGCLSTAGRLRGRPKHRERARGNIGHPSRERLYRRHLGEFWRRVS